MKSLFIFFTNYIKLYNIQYKIDTIESIMYNNARLNFNEVICYCIIMRNNIQFANTLTQNNDTIGLLVYDFPNNNFPENVNLDVINKELSSFANQYDDIYVIYHSNMQDKLHKNLVKKLETGKLKGYVEGMHDSDDSRNKYYKAAIDLLVLAHNNSNNINIKIEEIKKLFCDPILEAKLELLHSLLVPPQNLDVNYSSWSTLKEIAKYNEDSDKAKAWEKFNKDINEKANDYHNDPFNSVYIKALSELRDALLDN